MATVRRKNLEHLREFLRCNYALLIFNLELEVFVNYMVLRSIFGKSCQINIGNLSVSVSVQNLSDAWLTLSGLVPLPPKA